GGRVWVGRGGRVLVPRLAGAPFLVFHVGVDRGRPIKKPWAHFLLPGLFPRAILIGPPPIYVPQDADSEMIRAKHEEMQKALEHVRDLTEGWFQLTEQERNRHRAEIGP